MIYVNKMLVMAAENNYTGFKSLNEKYLVGQVDVKDPRGNTPLFYASRQANTEFVNHLLNLGADPSIACEKCTVVLVQSGPPFITSSKPTISDLSSDA